jgi:hypothetical protein
MVEVYSFFDIYLLYVNIGCVILFGCKVINDKDNKTMKTKLVSKKAKTWLSYSEKWHGTY